MSTLPVLNPKFPTGRISVTPGVIDAFEQFPGILLPPLTDLLERHLQGDWGEVAEEDKELNNAALEEGRRLLSAYTVNDTKIWIITESDRSMTTLLLPDEY